jgi:hypothetical protein
LARWCVSLSRLPLQLLSTPLSAGVLCLSVGHPSSQVASLFVLAWKPGVRVSAERKEAQDHHASLIGGETISIYGLGFRSTARRPALTGD